MEEQGTKQKLQDGNWRDLFDAIPGSVYALRPDLDDRFPVYMNRGCLEELEVETEEEARQACGGSFWNFVEPADVQMVRDVYQRLSSHIGRTEGFDCGVITAKGNRHLMHVLARSERDAEGRTLIVDFTTDLGPGHIREESADVDPMTGLLSMHAFFQAVESSREKSAGGNSLAILFVDLVNFRIINLHYGVAYGDRFLGAVAKAIRDCFPAAIAAHFGADHFAILAGAKDLAGRAGHLREGIRKMAPDTIDCSIGACRFDDPDLGPEAACSRAKIACDDNRKHLNTFFSLYREEMGESLETAAYVTANIDEAVQENWIQVYYQPIIRAVSG